MNDLSREDLQALFGAHDGFCVSLYMPTYRKGAEASGNPIRFKGLLKLAEEQLLAAGLRAEVACALLQPGREFLADHDWWENVSEGLAVFLREGFFAAYHLPLVVPELCEVAERFHVRPLLPLFAGEDRFYLLALSPKRVRLLESTRGAITELPLEGVPASLEEARRLFSVPEPIRGHISAAGGGRGGAPVTLSGGHGGSSESPEDDLREFLRPIAHAVQKVLHEATAPLVLAGGDLALNLYRQVNAYPHLAATALAGNPDEVKNEDLQRRAQELLRPHFAAAQQRAAEQYAPAAAAELGMHLVDEALPAALQGRVGVLFVPLEGTLWGKVDVENSTATVHEKPQPGDEDLLDRVAVETLLRGGTAYAVPVDQLPAKPVAAILRY
ncbi:MAG TPA: hypothetical protein VGM19_06195 [Armatimonadota bacterium]|jgi:hypothetical protein